MKQTSLPEFFKYRKSPLISLIFIISAFMFVLMSCFPLHSIAQNEPQYDEISILLNIQQFGGTEIPAVILDETVYLPVKDIFSFLKIKNNPSAQIDSITGFLSIHRRPTRLTIFITGLGIRERNMYLKSMI